jgi:hypothetical protein
VRHYFLRESVFTHFSVAFGVLLLSAALVISPQGKAFATTPPSSENVITAMATPAALQPDASAVASFRNSAASARGGRGAEQPAAVATPDVLAAPPLPATVAPTPAPTPIPTQAAPVPATAPKPSPAPVSPISSSKPALAQFRVGIQAGHWKEAELPEELASLRKSTGAAGNGWREADINLAVANRVAEALRGGGIQVDVLPATVPAGYKADAFLALHGDASANTTFSGYKMARARWSKIPQVDDALIQAVSAEYQATTGLGWHASTITENMRQYYAFNWPALSHAVAPTTTAAILEMGFLTTASDRDLLLGQQDRVATGIANGIIRFLTGG